jgi:hypothetical protein
MEPSLTVVTAVLNSIAYRSDANGAPIVPEAEFVPFDLSYLRDFPGHSEQEEQVFGGRAPNASDALPA